MKLTKYEHACFTLEKDGKLLIIDPGVFTTDLGSPENVIAIVVTHEHADHFDVNALGALIAHNPDAIIYAHENITRQFGDTLPHQAVQAGEVVQAGPFSLAFFGGEHAVIHPSFPPIANLGVMIDDVVYYPGDSFTIPDKPVSVLALPVTAPWLKISEVMDFLMEVKPQLAFPTHDAIASDAGKSLPDRMLPGFAESYGGTYQRIDGSIEV
jgi:L-ascorbate metabolism protein UlaG (beta-lactamase superfamily)